MKEYIVKVDFITEGGELVLPDIVGELTRCKNCYFCDTFQRKRYCTKYDHAVTQDGFCAWAEPKELHS